MPCAASFCSIVPAMFRPRLISLNPTPHRVRLFRASSGDMQARAGRQLMRLATVSPAESCVKTWHAGSEFLQVSELDSSEGKVTLSDLRSTSWEDGAGKSYRFKIDARTNDSDSSPVDGIAERTGDYITVKLTQPQAKTFTLDGATVFPTEQIQRIVAAAKQGKSLVELTVYDGSDNGQKVYNTLSVIGQPIKGEKAVTSPDPSISNEQMKSLTRWPVTVSYYDRDAKTGDGEQTPVYAMQFELFENGVSRALVLDYNDFVISGALGKFDVKDSKPCK